MTSTADRVDAATLDAAAPSVPYAARVRRIARAQLADAGRAVAGRLPGGRQLVDRPRTQPLRSGSIRLARWSKAAYGSDAKPSALQDIPWDYVETHQDSIPFLGLREYWYPAVRSADLRHNEAVPVTVAGDNLVLFRSPDGTARALENRCPHRGALLSLGQVGVVRPGTLTCRYHGMTFDSDGRCVAFIADGAASPAVGKIRARRYPATEHGGVVWVYTGDDPQPRPFLDSQPHARSVLDQPSLLVASMTLPYSHLNQLDNATDLTHVGVLHRSCVVFADQKPSGGIHCEEVPGGVRASYAQPGEHPGPNHIDHIDWYLPNLVYHAPGDLGAGLGEGWFWFVPRDVGSFTAWLMIGRKHTGNRLHDAAIDAFTRAVVSRGLFADRLSPATLASCLLAGDVPIQASQGRIVRWDHERLTAGDRAMVRARKMVREAHAAERAFRAERGIPERPLRRPDAPAPDAAPPPRRAAPAAPPG